MNKLLGDAYLNTAEKRLAGHQTHTIKELKTQMEAFVKFVGERGLLFPARKFTYKETEHYRFEVTPFAIESVDELLTLVKYFFEDYLMSFHTTVYFKMIADNEYDGEEGEAARIRTPDALLIHKVGIYDAMMRHELLKDLEDFYQVFEGHNGELTHNTLSFCNIVEFELHFGFVHHDGLEAIRSIK